MTLGGVDGAARPGATLRPTMATVHVDHGVDEVLGRGELAVLSRYRHALGAHRDPLRETVSRPTVVFTTRGRWGFGSERGGGLVDASSVVLLDAGAGLAVAPPAS